MRAFDFRPVEKSGVDQGARDDDKDPVDVFLALPKFRYEVFQRLPDLPVSRGTELEKHGSLAVHVRWT